MSISKLTRFAMLFLAILPICAHTSSDSMEVYSYISPPTEAILRKANVSAVDLERYVANELSKKLIIPIDSGRVFDGSEDAVRIDLRRAKNGIVVNLSVRQGVSVHNMLQRWEGSEVIIIRNKTSQQLQINLLGALDKLLVGLQKAYGSIEYKEGSMMEE